MASSFWGVDFPPPQTYTSLVREVTTAMGASFTVLDLHKTPPQSTHTFNNESAFTAITHFPNVVYQFPLHNHLWFLYWPTVLFVEWLWGLNCYRETQDQTCLRTVQKAASRKHLKSLQTNFVSFKKAGLSLNSHGTVLICEKWKPYKRSWNLAQNTKASKSF